MSERLGDVPDSVRKQRAFEAPASKISNVQGLAKALEMVGSPKPCWKDLAAGGHGRRVWLRYWLRDMPLDGLQWVLFHLSCLLPVSFVSSCAGFYARVVAPRLFPAAARRTQANLRWLEPAWSEQRRRDVALRHFENVGRLTAEFSILHRLMRGGRISIENGELARKTMTAGPVILLGAHVGNWEIVSPVMAEFGIPLLFIFEPPSSRIQARLSLKVRFRCGPAGSVGYIRNANAARAAVKWLKAGGTLVIFCDESNNGVSAAPFFGRSPRVDGNYGVAARLGRLTGAALLPFFVRRHAGCRFTMQFGSPIELAPTASLLEDVVQLNDAIEPTVRAHLDDWFWLDWGFADLEYSFER